MITLSEITEAYKNASEMEKREFLDIIIPDIKNIFDSSIDEKIFDIDYAICGLEEKIGFIEHNGTSCNNIEQPLNEQEIFIPESKTEMAFVEFVKFVSTKVKDGIRAITPKILHNEFRLKYLSPDLRPDTDNPRQWKKEFFEFVAKKIPGIKFVKLGNNRGIRMLIPPTVDIEGLKRKFCVS